MIDHFRLRLISIQCCTYQAEGGFGRRPQHRGDPEQGQEAGLELFEKKIYWDVLEIGTCTVRVPSSKVFNSCFKVAGRQQRYTPKQLACWWPPSTLKRNFRSPFPKQRLWLYAISLSIAPGEMPSCCEAIVVRTTMASFPSILVSPVS